MVARYQQPSLPGSIWQIVNTLVPFFTLWYVAYRSIDVSYGLTLLFSFVAGLFAMRSFVIFHDCCHGSFFASQRTNDIVGFLFGVLVLTPYNAWRHAHAQHHARSGDLDRRGAGDVWTMTLEEYRLQPFWRRVWYRFYRNPVIIFVFGPTIGFLVLQRFAQLNGANGPRERASVTWTNLGILAVLVLASFTIGLKEFALVQLPIVAFSTPIGVWLFYVQHQYENTYWERHKEWDFTDAALKGSSYYKLPKVLQWFTGNIGFHHIHHLCPRIPNYRLEACHNENRMFYEIEPLTIRESLKSASIRVFDEDRHRMIGIQQPPEGALI